MNSTAAKELLERYNRGTCTPEEKQLVEAWESTLEETGSFNMNEQQLQHWENFIHAQLMKQVNEEIEQNVLPVRSMSYGRYWWAAAILILAIGSGIYYLNNQSYKSQKSQKSQQITVQTKNAAPEIPPGTNKAILTLSNGIQKELGLADNGLQLQSDAVLLTTPNGGQYQAVLPDGSKVWLNAASSIKFPSTFTDKERRVEVTGEVYFEVMKDATKPFRVSGGGQDVEVLGTSFNINIYNDEPIKKTTLVTGAVKVNNKILKPGQAYINGTIVQTNTEQDIVWISGLFNFEGAGIEEVMRQLARWYDIEVQYEKGIPNIRFIGEMSRNVSLEGLLRVLEMSKVHYRMEGRKLIILP